MRLRLFPQPGYPFMLDLETGYALDEAGLTVRMAATNLGDEPCPFGAGAHPAMDAPYMILGFPDRTDPDVVYIELLTTALYLEKRDEVDHYMEVINHLSTQALTPDRTTRFLNEITRET